MSAFLTARRRARWAQFLARTPCHRLLSKAQRALTNYADLAENWNNGDELTNGERFLLERIGPSLRTACDVGANVGRWSAMLRAVNSQCVIHAFEASPATFEKLKEAIDADPRAHAHATGLGDREGVLPFHDYGDGSGLSSFFSRERSAGLKPDRIIEVPVVPFDQFAAERGLGHVDFVKIDTEGNEMAVLRGMRETLAAKRVSLIQFEYGGTWLDAGETLAGANEFVRNAGYALYRLRASSLEPVNYDCRRHECFKYANFAAAASEELLARWNIPIHH